MYTLNNPCCVKVMDDFSGYGSVGCGKHQLRSPRSGHLDFCILIYISIRMPCQCNGLFPVSYTGFNPLYHNRGTKYGSIQNSSDSSVGAFPHFLQIIFCHSCCIGSNGSTFYCHTIFQRSVSRIYRYLIFRFITVFQAQIIILCFQINEGKQ